MSGVRINSNVTSLQIQGRLAETSRALASSYQKLSSGMRINRASDDAAGLAVALGLGVGARVSSQAIRNISDGISMAGIAEGALVALRDITLRQQELAASAANQAYSLTQRQAMNAEANSLVEEYNRIVESAAFAGARLFSDDPQGVRIAAGAGVEGSLLLDFGKELSRNVGDGTFAAGQTFSVGDTPLSLAVADFNGDGRTDIVTADSWDDTVSVALGKGDGTFEARQVFAAGSIPSAVVAGDLNGDGRQDIITGDYGGSISVLIGNGDGTFQAARSFSANDSIQSVAIGDVNGDGRLDVAAGGYGGSVTVYLGNGDGTFQAGKSFAGPGALHSVTASDLNGDGLDDLVAASYWGTSAAVYIARGDGTFEQRQTFSPVGWVMGAAVGDLNGDGCPDVVIDGTAATSVYLGNGDGTFQPAKSAVDAGGLMTIADLNGDGRQDLFTNTNVQLGN